MPAESDFLPFFTFSRSLKVFHPSLVSQIQIGGAQKHLFGLSRLRLLAKTLPPDALLWGRALLGPQISNE